MTSTTLEKAAAVAVVLGISWCVGYFVFLVGPG
jgi:hypothetical protein